MMRLRLLFLVIALAGARALTLGAAMGRRAAILGATSSLVALPRQQAAHADSIEEIAARSNAIAEQQAAAAAKKAEGSFLEDAGASAFNLALTGATVLLLGGAATFFASISADSAKIESTKFTKDPGGNTLTGYESTYDKK